MCHTFLSTKKLTKNLKNEQLAKIVRKITTFTLIGSSNVDHTVINVLQTVHSVAIIQILLFVFCSQ